MKKLFASLLLIACTFASCNKSDNTEKPFLTVEETNIICESNASQFRFEIKSNVEWKLVQQDNDPLPWVEFGVTDYGLMIWVQENTSYQRSKPFQIKSKDGTIVHDLTITQNQPEGFIPGGGEDSQLSVTPNRLLFPWEGGTKTVEINSTTIWRILEGEVFVLQPTISPISGTGKTTLTITVPKSNKPQTTRATTNIESVVKIVSGSQMVELTVVQGTEIPMG